MALRKFDSSQLVLTHDEAWQVLVAFFGGNAGTVPGWLTENDRSFAQALLVEAIDKSYAMSWIEEIFRSAYKPGASVKSIIRKLATKAAKDWFKHVSQSEYRKLKDPTIYQAVKNTLTRNWRSAWVIRTSTDEPVY